MTATLGPTSHTYFSQRMRLHYTDWGNPDAPPMILIHGGRDHCRNWDWVAEHFRHDYHIIAPDLRGHGDSEWMLGGSYNQIDYVYDIAQLLQQKQMSPVTVIGHSLGGSISLLYTALHPDRVNKLVAIEGMGPPPSMIKERMDQTMSERLHGWMNDVRKSSGRLVRGLESWASDPIADGRTKSFNCPLEVEAFADAGHWVHHDQLDGFVARVKTFLNAPA